MTKIELENKDKEIARLWEHKKVDVQTIQEQSDLIEELKAKLAEKDKEIEALKYLCGCPNDINEMVRKVIYRDEHLCKQYDFFQGELKRKDQDKISFCIEQLEKVKEKTKIFFVKATHKHNEHYSAQYNMITDFDLCFAIDDQIEELKKEMK